MDLLRNKFNLFLRQIFHKHLLKSVIIYRLGKIVREAFRKITFLGSENSISCETYHRNIPARTAFSVTYLMQCFGSRHLGHTLIHEDHVITVSGGHSYSFSSGCGSVDLDLGVFQKIYRNRQIDLCIIYDQDICCRCTERLSVRSVTGHVLLEPCLEIPYWCIRNDLLGNHYRKDGTFTVFALDIDSTTHQPDQMMGNGEPQSCSLQSAVAFHFQALKPGKQLLFILRLYSYTGIPYNDSQVQHIITLSFAAEFKAYRTLIRILNCVVEKIGKYLTHSDLITRQFIRNRRINFHSKLQPLILSFEEDHVIYVVY